MNKPIRIFFVSFLFLIPSLLEGQNSYLAKTVNIPAGQIRLKSAFKLLSNQTGCVFSYEAAKVDDEQIVTVNESRTLSLQKALQNILPPDLHFRMMGKYVVLKKVRPQNKPALEQLSREKYAEILFPSPIRIPVDRQNNNTSLTYSDNTHTAAYEGKTVNNAPVTVVQDTSKKIGFPSEPLLNVALSANHHLASLSTRVGMKNIYGIATLGYDYYGSYHLGIGAGARLKLTKEIDAGVDLVQYGLIAGKSKKLDIKTYTTEVTPVLNFAVGQNIRLFAGPSFYLIKSRLMTKKSSINLGSHIECNATLGLSMNLTDLFSKKGSRE